ncbi:hypothetical protein OROHE_011602 [Orobanche hederae]
MKLVAWMVVGLDHSTKQLSSSRNPTSNLPYYPATARLGYKPLL